MAEIFKNGKSYSCVNTHKCAIIQTLGSIGHLNFDKSVIIARFMKGVFNVRLPLPRYSVTWDVGKIIQYMSSLFPLDELSLKMLTLKLVALLALSTAQRAQTLVNLHLNKMIMKTNQITFYICSLMKTSKVGQTGQTIMINKFNKPEVCPVLTLRHFINRTENVRKSNRLIRKFLLQLYPDG